MRNAARRGESADYDLTVSVEGKVSQGADETRTEQAGTGRPMARRRTGFPGRCMASRAATR